MHSAPAACEHLAYEIDAATGTITVVYIGTLTDDDVIGFYTRLVERHAEAPSCNYLLDLRYTDWRATPDVIAGIDQLFSRKQTTHHRRIAIVRKSAATINKLQQTVLSEGMKDRVIRYFTDMELARVWLRETP